jgi:Ca2+-binding EF-hand superfamily protein
MTLIVCFTCAVTTQQAFAEADLNHDGKLSYAEFTKWYMASNSSSELVRDADKIKNMWTLEEIRSLTGLGEMPVRDVFSVFADAADNEGIIDREAFDDCVARLVGPSSNLGAGAIERMADELFDIFDTDGNGVVDFTELSSGLSVLCGGDRDDKVMAAFALFDTNGDGYISKDEMALYLTSVFKLIFATKPELEGSLQISAEELGAVTAEQAFEDADIDHDGKISFLEFKRWYAAGGGAEQLDSFQRQVPSNMTLNVVREVTGLQDCDVNAVVRLFESAADRNGSLSRSAFNRCFRTIINSTGDPNDERLQLLNSVLANLFDLFDEDASGHVDSNELICGLTVLCAGRRDDKVRAAFETMDTNSDGFLSKDEMHSYLRSVFKVLYETNPGSYEHTGVDADTLAAETTDKAFEDADADHDGLLSFEEFTHW